MFSRGEYIVNRASAHTAGVLAAVNPRHFFFFKKGRVFRALPADSL